MNYLAIIFSRPNMALVFHLDELSGDSHSICFAPDAAFQDVLDLKLTTDLVQWLSAAFILHDRGAGDNSKVIRIKIPELGDHLLSKAVTEVVLACIAGEVLEREHGHHYSGGR